MADRKTRGARSRYMLWRYGFTHYRFFANDCPVHFNLKVQETRDRLIAAEQFGVGVATSIRGFDERKFANDCGAYVNRALYSLDSALLLKVGGPESKICGVLFHNYGHAVRDSTAVTEQFGVTTSRVGIGLRISHGNSLTIRLNGVWTDKLSRIDPKDTSATLASSTRNFGMHGALVHLF